MMVLKSYTTSTHKKFSFIKLVVFLLIQCFKNHHYELLFIAYLYIVSRKKIDEPK